MKTKLLIAAVLVVGFVGYSLYARQHTNKPTAAATNTKSSSPSTSTTPPTPASSATYKDGSYTGTVVDAFYGNIQVKAIIQGGKITDVQFLQFPNDQPNSVAVSNQSTPVLKQEAIAAQSAQVDVVSGATDTSQAFVKSLSAALANAKA